MNCNRCGNPVEPNTTFCRTCGNQINNTVVPQTVNQPTVVPTVVPQKNNNATVLTIVLVLVIFIGAGVAGVTLLKQTKANNSLDNRTQNIALNEETTKLVNKANETTKKTGWKTTTTQKMDIIENVKYYEVNGVNIIIPDGYTPSYTNNILTVYYNDNKYYMVNVVDVLVKTIDVEIYQQNLINQGYEGKNFNLTTIGEYDVLKFDMDNNIGHIDAFLVQAKYNKTAIFMFVDEKDSDRMNNIIIDSLGK